MIRAKDILLSNPKLFLYNPKLYFAHESYFSSSASDFIESRRDVKVSNSLYHRMQGLKDCCVVLFSNPLTSRQFTSSDLSELARNPNVYDVNIEKRTLKLYGMHKSNHQFFKRESTPFYLGNVGFEFPVFVPMINDNEACFKPSEFILLNPRKVWNAIIVYHKPTDFSFLVNANTHSKISSPNTAQEGSLAAILGKLTNG